MFETYIAKKFRPDSLSLIDLCNEVIENYLSMGLRLTLRQLYYQLVTRNAITNEERSYKKLSSLVSDARLAGLTDWEAIEDRIRVPYKKPEFTNLKDLIDAAIASYRLPRWEGQKYNVELWVEKDALAGVLRPLADKYHVVMMVNRGYSSQTSMYEGAQRFKEKGQAGVLLYLGDHDASGEDMVRDIQNRLNIFNVKVAVVKIALTKFQIDLYNPPSNPAKMSDPRATAYVKKHGAVSWEVDALPPDVLGNIIEEAFTKLIDKAKVNAVKRQEEKDKKWLLDIVKEKV